MKLGVLDVGTNSIHILIAQAGKDMGFEILGRAKDMVRLGDGTLKSGFIQRPKLERALAVVKHFVQLARNRGVGKILGVATAVIREAANGGEFVDRVRKETGLKLNVVTGDEEARLIYLAVRHFMDLRRPGLIVDIGGGSAELIVGNEREAPFARSLKLGGARLKDLFIHKYPVSKGDLQRVRRHIREVLAPTLEELRQQPFSQVIGTSGTLINLGSVLCERLYDRPLANPQGFSYSRRDLAGLARDLARRDEEEIAALKGVDPNRRDILLPGALLVLEVLDVLGQDRVVLCDKGIREGVILDFIAKNAPRLALEAEIPNVRLRGVLQLARRCEYDEAHAKQTARLALALYDQLAAGADLHPSARELLEYGSLLHDIGYHVSYDGHHKHGWYLIENSELYGFTPDEIEILACLARYHRRRAPRKRDLWMRGLSKSGRRTIGVLTAILRVADALDHSHFEIVESLRANLSKKAVTLRIAARSDPAMELWTARQKADLLAKVLGREVRIIEEARKSPAGVQRKKRSSRRKQTATGRFRTHSKKPPREAPASRERYAAGTARA